MSKLFLVQSGLEERLMPSFHSGRISLDPECISFSMEQVQIQLLAALGFALLHINTHSPQMCSDAFPPKSLPHYFGWGLNAFKITHRGLFHY